MLIGGINVLFQSRLLTEHRALRASNPNSRIVILRTLTILQVYCILNHYNKPLTNKWQFSRGAHATRCQFVRQLLYFILSCAVTTIC